MGQITLANQTENTEETFHNPVKYTQNDHSI